MWRQGRRRKLLNLIHHLPRASHFREAVSQDEKHVEMILSSRQHAEQRDTGPALSEYDSTVERLDQVIDLMQVQIATTAAAAGAKKLPKVTPQKRPASAYERVQHRQRVAGTKSIAARFLPSKRAVDSDAAR